MGEYRHSCRWVPWGVGEYRHSCRWVPRSVGEYWLSCRWVPWGVGEYRREVWSPIIGSHAALPGAPTGGIAGLLVLSHVDTY